MSIIKDYKLFSAILIVAIVWGTTFLGIKIGVETIPSWFVAGLRQLLASLILLPILFFSKKLHWIGWKNARIQFVLSALMLIGANGLTTLAEEHLASNLTSLISALSPIAIFVGSVFVGFEKFTLKTILGFVLAFSGVIFIFWDGINELANPDYRFGLFVLLCGIVCWATGTLYAKKLQIKSDNLLLNLFYQFAFAGVVQLIFAFLFSEKIDVNEWSGNSIAAIIYLAIFGSVIAFFSYHYLLKNLLPSQVSILSYVNTMISIFLGWLVLHEPISVKFLMAAALIICGVFVINYKPGMIRRKKQKLSH